MRNALLVATMFLAVFAPSAGARPAPRTPPATPATTPQDQFPPDFVPTGKAMFKQYCAACHGMDAKGHGPARAALKVPAADLTTLAKRHGGEFPVDMVTNVLRFGPGVAAHGSSDMPTWGSIFRMIDKNNERAVQARIKNLTDYLVSLQVK